MMPLSAAGEERGSARRTQREGHEGIAEARPSRRRSRHPPLRPARCHSFGAHPLKSGGRRPSSRRPPDPGENPITPGKLSPRDFHGSAFTHAGTGWRATPGKPCSHPDSDQPLRDLATRAPYCREFFRPQPSPFEARFLVPSAIPSGTVPSPMMPSRARTAVSESSSVLGQSKRNHQRIPQAPGYQAGSSTGSSSKRFMIPAGTWRLCTMSV